MIQAIENKLIPFSSPAMIFQHSKQDDIMFQSLEDRMQHYKVPGISITFVNDSRVDWYRVYGVMDVNTCEPITNDSIFEAASTSKMLTSLIVLHCVEKGILELDTDVNNYLNSWKIPTNEFTIKEKITLRRLLIHMSGLPSTNMSYDERIGIPTLIQILEAKSPAINEPAIPNTIPGTNWEYSNIGYAVIQLILEDVLKKPFNEIAKMIILDPLEMNSSTFTYPLSENWQNREVKPHDAEGVSQKPSMNNTAVAHAGLLTTTNDLAKLAIELMLSYKGKSNKIISKEMTKKFFTKQLDLDPTLFGIPLSEGLGVMLYFEDNGIVFTHPGSNLPGLNCWFIGWLEKGIAIVIMTNGALGEILSIELISAISRII